MNSTIPDILIPIVPEKFMKVSYLCLRISILLIAGLLTACERANDKMNSIGSDGERQKVKSILLHAGMLNKTHPDSAFLLYSQALKIAGNGRQPGIVPEIFYNLGFIHSGAMNYKTAINFLDTAIILAGKNKDYGLLARSMNELGNIEDALRDTTKAGTFFRMAYKTAMEHQLFKEAAAALANLAIRESDPAKSVLILKEARILVQKSPGSEAELAYIDMNLGFYQVNPDSAIVYLKRADSLARKVNVSEIRMAANNNLAYVFMDKNLNSEAIRCLKENAIPLALSESNFSWLAKIYDTYSDVMKSMGETGKALELQDRAYHYRIKAEEQKAASQTRLLINLLDLKIKENKIIEQEDKSRVMKLRIVLLLVVIVLISVLLISLIIIFHYRNQKKQEEMTIRMLRLDENEKTRISSQLHDLIGPFDALLRQHLATDVQRPHDRAGASESELSDLASKLRQLSHLLNSHKLKGQSLVSLLARLVSSFSIFPGLSVRLDLPDDDTVFPEEITIPVYFISLELLNNAVKHVGIGNVDLKLNFEKKRLYLIYRDDGKGFDIEKAKEEGLGLRNIFDRVSLANGNCTLTSNPGKGTTWTIVIPKGKF